MKKADTNIQTPCDDGGKCGQRGNAGGGVGSTPGCCNIGGWGSPESNAWILRTLVVVVSLVLCSLPLTGDLYGDEGHTFRTISQGDLLENLSQKESCHPPLFFALAKLCWQVTGQQWAIRLPSLLAALGTVLLSGFLTKRLLANRYVTAAMVMVGLSPLLIEFAAEARPYSMLLFFSTALLLLMARFLERENWLDSILLALVAACGLMTHFIFAAQLVFVACWYLWRRRKLTKYSIVALLLFAPVGFYLVTGAADDAGFSKSFTEAWRQQFSWTNYLGRLPFALTFGYCTFNLGSLGATRQVGMDMVRANLPAISLCVLFFAGAAAGCIHILAKRPQLRPKLLGLLAAVFIPLAVGLLGGKAGFYLLREKYFIGSLVPYMLILLVSVDAIIAKRRWCVVFAAAYLAVAALSLYNYTARPEVYSRRTFRSALNSEIANNLSDGDRIVSYFVNRVEPWYFTVLDGNEASVDLRVELGKRVDADTAAAYADSLSGSVSGTIYVIDREMDRNTTDPSNAFVQQLASKRAAKIKSYGRNLQLYIFSPGQISEATAQ